MKCKDCKGSGVYLGLERQETCARCQGSCVEPKGRELPALEFFLTPDGKTVVQRKPRFEWEPKEAPPYAEAIRDWHAQRDQLAHLHTTPQVHLADAIRELPDPLPQIVFDGRHYLFAPTCRWWWLDGKKEWSTGCRWALSWTCATPGPEPAPDAPVLRIETVEALEALVERYRDA